MPEERLLERIHHLAHNPDLRSRRDTQLEVRSIISHLRRLLNTRQGSVEIADDYGIPDFTAMAGDNYADAVDEMERSIKRTINKYEKRLQDVKIIIDQDNSDVFSIRFKLEAFMIGEDKIPVIFNTVFRSDGKININSE